MNDSIVSVDDEVFNTLNKYFNHTTLRPGQLSIIKNILSNKDVLVCKEKGYGKALCYQVAGVMRKGLVVVVSSITSRLESKFLQLSTSTIIKCAFLKYNATNESHLKNQDLRSVLNKKNKLLEDLQYVHSSGLKFLFVTLDYFVNSLSLKQILRDLRKDDLLLSVVIEDIHCKNPWDPKYKQDSKNLASLRSTCSHVPFLCFTKPISKEKLDKLKDTLLLRNPFVLNEPLVKENFYVKVMYKHEEFPADKLIEFISETYAGKYGLIYCHNEANCLALSEGLQTKQLNAIYYNSDLTDDEKLWISRSNQNEIIVICESGFDVEVNLPKIDFVVHTSMPSSLDIYMQEASKAGTNTERGDCNVFYSIDDYNMNLRSLTDGFLQKIDSEENSENKKQLLAELKDHRREIFDGVVYAENINLCRQVFLLNYFNEDTMILPCGICDVCGIMAESFLIDMSFILKKILLAVWDINKNQKAQIESDDFTFIVVNNVVALLMGKEEEQFVNSWMIDEWFYGSFHSWDQPLLYRLFFVLLSQKFLKVNQVANDKYEVFQNLIITQKGQEFIKSNNELNVSFSLKDIYLSCWIKQEWVIANFWKELKGVLFYFYMHEMHRHLPDVYSNFVEYLYHAVPGTWEEFKNIKMIYVPNEISELDQNLFSVCMTYHNIISKYVTKFIFVFQRSPMEATKKADSPYPKLRTCTKAESLEGFINDDSFNDLLNIRYRDAKKSTTLAATIGTSLINTIDSPSPLANTQIIGGGTHELIIKSIPLRKRERPEPAILAALPGSPTSLNGCVDGDNSIADVVDNDINMISEKHRNMSYYSKTAKQVICRKRSTDEVDDHVSSSTEIKRLNSREFYKNIEKQYN